jgi:hypothetical protein
MSTYGRLKKSIIRRMRAGKHPAVVVFPERCVSVCYYMFNNRPFILTLAHRDLVRKSRIPRRQYLASGR